MTDVTTLIEAVLPHIPFSSKATAQSFLNQYSTEDQAALISALYIGRTHLEQHEFDAQHLSGNIPFDRFYETGDGNPWIIPPEGFARILYEKDTNLKTYYDTFLECAAGSSFSLENF